MPSKKVASAYVDLQLRTAQFKAAIGEATGEMRKFSAQSREEMNKSRESVRLLSEELGLGIPRGLQNIISKLPGLTTAMNLAFDGVVVLALIKTVVEVTEKIVDFAKKNGDAAQKSAASWKEITSSVGGVNRELTLSNAHLQDSIAKLEHKPGDGLKTALLEAADAAHKLSEKLDDDLDKLLKLTTERKVGLLDELSGHGQDDIDRTIGYGAQQYRQIVPQYDAALQSAASRGDWSNYEQIRQDELKALHAAIDPQISTLGDYLRQNQDLAITNPNEPSYAKAKNGYSTLSGLLSAIEGQSKQEQGTHAQTGLQIGSTADAERLKAMEDQFAKEKAMWGANVLDEIKFWSYKINAFSKGSEQYRTVSDKLFGLYGDRSNMLSGIGKGAKASEIQNVPEDVVSAGLELNKMIADQADDVLHTGDRWKEFNTTLAKGYESYNEFTEKLSEARLKIQESTGAITPHDAVMQQAAIHAAAYAHSLAILQDQLKHINGDTSLTPAQRTTAGAAVGNQISDLGYNYQIQQVQDTQAQWSTSFQGGMDSAFDDLIKRSQDFNAQFKALLSTTVSDINDAILKLFTTGRGKDPHPFRAAGHEIFTGVAHTGLQDAEGGLLKAIGMGGKDVKHVIVDNFPKADGAIGSVAHSGLLGALNDSNWAGKLGGGRLFGRGGIFDPTASGLIPDGSTGGPGQANSTGIHVAGAPAWISTAASIAKAAISMGSSFANNASSGGDDTGGYAVTQGVAPTGSFDSSGDYIQARANGGLMSPGDWYMTGEQGPELLQVGSTSKINNARDTASMFSGGGAQVTNHSWNIDARGATDPAAIHAAVQRGIMQAAPHIVAASHASQRDQHSRKPSSSR